MTAHALPGTRPVPAPRPVPNPHNEVGRTQLIRDALGRASYERMAAGFARAGMPLDGWDDLREGTREAYRARLDYLLPRLLEALDADALLGGVR